MLTVRGTLSINDALTDLTVSMEEIRPEHRVEEVEGLQYAHKVVYQLVARLYQTSESF